MTYRVVPSPFYTRPQLALARSYSDLPEALAVMGDGMVVAGPDARLVAFHERHLAVLQRRSDLCRR